MTVCAACGQVSPDDRDFCANVRCGAYLRWDEPAAGEEPTQELPQTPEHEPTAELEIEPEVIEHEPARVTLVRPGDTGARTGPLEVAVAPGDSLRLVGGVFNQSGIVDHYDLRIAGMDPAWWTIAPGTVSLMPHGSGTAEARVEVTLHPPRLPEARAGEWEIALVAHSHTHDRDVAVDHARLRMAAFHQLDSRVRPQTVRDQRRARFEVPVRNLGNEDADLTFEGEDDEGQLRFEFDPPSVRLPPRGEAHAALTVTAPATVADSARHRRLTIVAGDGDARVEQAVTFVQEPVAPVVRRSSRSAYRVALTALAVACLVSGALLDWDAQGSAGICFNGDSECLSYRAYIEHVFGSAPPAPGSDDLGVFESLFFGVTSIGVLAVVLGFLILLGARTARFSWAAGILAIVLAIVMFATIGAGGIGVWLVLVGGAAAIGASLLARH